MLQNDRAQFLSACCAKSETRIFQDMIRTEWKKTMKSLDDHLRDFLIAFPIKLSEFIEFNEFKSVEPSK